MLNFDPGKNPNLQHAYEMQTEELRTYAFRSRDDYRNFYAGPHEHQYHALMLACIERDTASFEPVHDFYTYGYIMFPETWLDHIKKSLPRRLQHGWFKPKMKAHRYTTSQTAKITIRSMQLVIAPPNARYFTYAKPTVTIEDMDASNMWKRVK